MLSDIRRYLIAKPDNMVSLYELASHFDVEEAVMSGMLSHWLRKGRITRVTSAACEQSCGGCDKGGSGEWYQWSPEETPTLISMRSD